MDYRRPLEINPIRRHRTCSLLPKTPGI